MANDFDVFLSHNSKDKPTVRQLADALVARGLKVWLDERELVPGRPWQVALEEIIRTTKSAAVLVGADGLGPWESPEMQGCLSEFVERQLPVIPVLLPGSPAQPALPLFLKGMTWVDLHGGIGEDGLNRLVWGITGKKPDKQPGSEPQSPSPDEPVTIVLDRTSHFIGGDEAANTFAILLNRARKRRQGPADFRIVHRGVLECAERQRQLGELTARVPKEEEEYRHLFHVSDFLNDKAVPLLARAIDLAVNEDRFREDTFLSLDDRLAQFLTGVRNQIFGLGTPVFPGDSFDRPWMFELNSRPLMHFLWWREDPALLTKLWLSQEEKDMLQRDFMTNRGGIRVFSEGAALDIYALWLDTFHRVALPAVALVIAARWTAGSHVPNSVLQFNQWVFASLNPKETRVLPPVSSDEFRDLLDPQD